MDKRTAIIFEEIEIKCKEADTIYFECYFEVLGHLWYHNILEIKEKEVSLSIKVLKSIDLQNLVNLGKIEIVKKYSKEEMKDEFNRIRYSIKE